MHTEIDPEVLERLTQQNPYIILRYLLAGREWEHKGEKYVLSDDHDLCVVRTSVTYKDGEACDEQPCYLRADISFQGFLKMAFETDIDDTAVMAMNMALQDIHRPKNRRCST